MHEHSQTAGMTVQEAMKFAEVVERLPSFAPPDHPPDIWHLYDLRDPDPSATLCGLRLPNPEEKDGDWHGTTVDVCPTCRDIATTYERTGIMP